MITLIPVVETGTGCGTGCGTLASSTIKPAPDADLTLTTTASVLPPKLMKLLRFFRLGGAGQSRRYRHNIPRQAHK
jgi:hypothetical protein